MGLFLIIGVLFLLASWMWWKDLSIFAAPQRFKVLFKDVAGLTPNAAVQVNGFRVGNVEDIDIAGRNIVVGLKITNTKVRIPLGSRVSIYANGIIGAKYIEIRLPETAGKRALLSENSVLVGEPPIRAELLMETLSKQANELDIARVQDAVLGGMGRVGRAADGASALYGRVGRAADGALVLYDRVGRAADGASLLYNKVGRAADNTSALVAKVGGLTGGASQLMCKFGTAADRTTALVNRMGPAADKAVKVEEQLSSLAENLNKVTNTQLQPVLCNALTMENRLSCLADELNWRSKTDLKGTLIQAQSALCQTELFGKQLSKTLDRRFPLLQLLFGRPGHLKPEEQRCSQPGVPTEVADKIKY